MHRVLLTILFCIALTAPCSGQLRSDEVAVIAARGNRDSEELAKYYVRVRHVPPENVCLVEVPTSEVCPPETWRGRIRPEIQKWLVENDPAQKIRCLVTLWGVPLKITPGAPNAESKKYRQFLEAERDHRLKLLERAVQQFDQVAADGKSPTKPPETPAASTESNSNSGPILTVGGAKSPDSMATIGADQPGRGPAPRWSAELTRWQVRLEAALQSAQARLAKLPEADRNRGQMDLQRLAAATGGLSVIASALDERIHADASGNSQMRSDFDAMQGRIGALVEAKSLLEQTPPSIERDALVMAVIERFAGLIGSIRFLDQQLNVVWRDETGASFDSELSLVMWPDGYQLLRWQPNYLHAIYSNSQLPTVQRTLMVARIDAPTLKLAKGLIDTAIEVEQQGLHGKLYIDARGIARLDDANLQRGSYGDYDRSLLLAAKRVREQTDLEVVIDDTPQLFQPGQCPEAAMYCGWLSLSKYVDAFDWAPGAIAFHLAGNEAATLHDPNSQAWCKKLIEDGVCATIGPVDEPYISAFPRPDEFFNLLVRGDLTLAECYYQTQPCNSWMMTLIGDPLYRPFLSRAPAPPPKTPKPAEKRPLQSLPLPPGSEP